MSTDREIFGSDHLTCLRHSGVIPPPPNLAMEYTQLTPAPIQGEGRDLILPGFMLRSCRTQTTIGASGYGGVESHIFAIVSNPQGNGRLNGRTLCEGLTSVSGIHPFEALLPPMEMVCLAISRDILNDYLEAVEGIGPPAQMYDSILSFDNLPAITSAVSSMKDLLTKLGDAPPVRLDDEGRRSIIWSILDGLVPTIVDSLTDMATDCRLSNRYKIVARTREYILDRIDEPLQISTVCRDLGVSRRALQYSFQDVLNINPVAFIRILRLNGARRDLVKTTTAVQVKDVIDRWGFWHPSRFSGEYKQMFQELPSETLRRCRTMA